jgi:hypothetical protein
MSLWQALIATVITLSSLLLILHAAILLILVIKITSRYPQAVLDKERMSELALSTALGRFSYALHPIAFWWLNVPTFLYQRMIKRNRRSTFSDPRGREES